MHPIISNNWFIRYKFGSAKKVSPPALPEPVATPTPITVKAQEAGSAERRRLSGKKGRAGTIFAGRRAAAPATVERRGLKTTFG